MASKVYFCSFRTKPHGANLLEKLQALMKAAGFETIDFKDKFTAIKMHFGEKGGLAFLRPNYARVVADYVRALGGKPFLTDCNTLYAGSRKNALEHLDTAVLNGFSPLTTNCQVIIADGLKGNDEVEVPVPRGEYCRTAKIGRAVMDSDVIISLNHFKCHEIMGLGGAVKNIGMGCGSRAGKMEMHSDGRPNLDADSCIGCGMCKHVCAHGALTLKNGKMTIDYGKCVGCGSCIAMCPKDALQATWGQDNRLLDCKTAEYAAAVLQGRPSFHISLICDVSPNCDCHRENDAPLIPDIGMVAGFDPVALDMAAADLCNQAPRLPGTFLEKLPDTGDIFNDAHSVTHWRYTFEHAVKIGLGSDKYELIKID